MSPRLESRIAMVLQDLARHPQTSYSLERARRTLEEGLRALGLPADHFTRLARQDDDAGNPSQESST